MDNIFSPQDADTYCSDVGQNVTVIARLMVSAQLSLLFSFRFPSALCSLLVALDSPGCRHGRLIVHSCVLTAPSIWHSLSLSLSLSVSVSLSLSLSPHRPLSPSLPPLSLSTLPARAESVVHSTARRLQATNEHPQDSAKARRITLLRVLLRAPVTLIANHNPGQSNLVAKLKRWPLFDLEEMLATLWHVGTWGHSMIHQQIAMMCGPDGQRLSADHQQALSVRVCVHAFLPLLSQAFDSPTASTVAPPAECCERCL